MKTALVPILSGVALALMAGAATTHYFSVKQMVSLAAQSPGNRLAPTEPGSSTAHAMAAIEGLKRHQASLQQVLAGNEARLASIDGSLAPSPGDADLKRLLAELVAQNRYLRDQIAETNRDLMELQFRVDTHSEQFRPLKLDGDPSGGLHELDGYDIEDDAYDTSIGVLPPLDLP